MKYLLLVLLFSSCTTINVNLLDCYKEQGKIICPEKKDIHIPETHEQLKNN